MVVPKHDSNPMSALLHRVFIQHPSSVDESYWRHLSMAAGFSIRLLGAGLAALVHAFIPCLFTSTARNLIAELNDKLTNRVQ